MGGSRDGKGAGGGQNNMVEGRNDVLKLHPKRSIWVRFCSKTYSYEVYDRDTAQVVDVVDAFWFEAVSHYVASNYRSFWCSAGPHRDKPCFGDSVRDLHYTWLRKEKEKTGVDPKKEAPISASPRVILALTILDTCLGAHSLDKEGNVKGNQSGVPYINWTPAQIVKFEKLPYDETKTREGMKAYFNIPPTVFDAVTTKAEEVAHYCANCPAGSEAHPLVYRKYKCEECGATHSYDEAIKGNEIEDIEVLVSNFRCTKCRHKGPKVPVPVCTQCNDAKPGTLFDFDFRMKKKAVGENSWTIEWTGMRVKVDNKTFDEMTASPLDIVKICGPSSSRWQEGCVPEPLRMKAGARRHIKEAKEEAEPYGDVETKKGADEDDEEEERPAKATKGKAKAKPSTDDLYD
jgi:hypothetical protein